MKKISLPAFLWIVYSIFIVYATTIPFNVIRSGAQLAHNVRVISWKPFYNTDQCEYFSKANIITNVLFFIPFGVFCGYSLQRRKYAPTRILLMAALLGVCLSAFVEFLQMFTTDRNTSTTDLITNGSGALLGAVFSLVFHQSGLNRRWGRQFSRMMRAPSLFPFLGVGFLMIAASWAPFDFVLSRYRVFNEIHSLFGTPSFTIDNNKDFVNTLYFFTLFSLSCGLVLREWSMRRVRIPSAAVGIATGIGVIFAQAFMGSRHIDWGTCFGVGAGVLSGLLFLTFTKRRIPKTIQWFLLVGCIGMLVLVNFAGPVARSNSLGDLLTGGASIGEALESLSNFIRITGLFIPAGFLMAYFGSSMSKFIVLPILLCLIPALAFVVVLSLSHGISLKHSVGTLILAESGVVIGAAACRWGWRVFEYYARQIGDGAA